MECVPRDIVQDCMCGTVMAMRMKTE